MSAVARIVESISEFITWLALKWIGRVQSKRLANLPPDFTSFQRLDFKPGSFEAEVKFQTPDVINEFALQAARMLTDNDAENYVQIDLWPKCQLLDPIRLTVQWAMGESPAVMNARLRKELAELKAKLAEVES